LTVLRDEAQALRRGRFGTRPKPVDRTASVLVPVLNEEAHLPETVPPMLGQRFEGKIEFLFIDGGSTDGSLAILEALAEVDDRIRVLPNPRRQTTTALNIGLEHAQGEFVVRMDAHSMYPDNYVARGVERLLEGDVEWVSGPAIAEGTGRWSAPVSAALKTPLGQGGSRKWAPGAAEIELDTGVFTGIWRRSYLEEIGKWDEGWPVNQDSELAARVFERGGRIVCLPELAASYSPRNSAKGLAGQYWR
jgi:succinoglycan biosynthesis protein ExoA